METNNTRLLKITSILMIIGGVMLTILGIMAVLGATVLTAMAGSQAGLVIVAAVFILASGLISLIAGILGVSNAAKPEKALLLIKFGILAVLFSIVSNVMTLTSGEDFNYSSVIIGLAIPMLFLYGAIQSKKRLV